MQKSQDLSAIKISKQQSLISLPSTFSANPTYCNSRLIRIKEKIDQLFVKAQLRPKNEKTQLNEDSSTMNSNEMGPIQKQYASRSNTACKIPQQAITDEFKSQVRAIYNQIHSLFSICQKDEQSLETNTVELGTFVKSLKNQKKRLLKILPEWVLNELDLQKAKSTSRASVQIEDLKQDAKEQKGLEPSQRELQEAQKQINEQFSRRRVFKQEEKYYTDDQKRCRLLKCQLI